MKQLTQVLSATLLAVLLLARPTAATSGQEQLRGTVYAVDAAANTSQIQTSKGVGVVYFDAASEITQQGNPGQLISLAEVVVGDEVHVWYITVNGRPIVTRMRVEKR